MPLRPTQKRHLAFHWSRQFDKRLVLAVDIAENADAGTVQTLVAALPFRAVVDAVKYVNPTGLAAHASNYAVLAVKQGANVCADWSTESGQEGTLGAGTYVDMTLGAEADRILEADEEIVFEVAETGTTTVPAGRVEVHLKLVDDDVAFKVMRALKRMRIEQVDLKMLDGLAASDTNYYVFQLKNGATVMASWSTKTTGGNGALTADTFATMVLSATDANLVAAAGDVLSLDCAETGDALLSDLELVIHARYV